MRKGDELDSIGRKRTMDRNTCGTCRWGNFAINTDSEAGQCFWRADGSCVNGVDFDGDFMMKKTTDGCQYHNAPSAWEKHNELIDAIEKLTQATWNTRVV